ncbi:MAG: rRNA maturation RNase YbeY [Bacteroidales bacterium]|nr:rRNA maturation RNase YbeY [Bacteroidales bacterium]
MEMNFFTENVELTLENEDLIREWISKVSEDRSFKIGVLNYIFTDDQTLHHINQKYLNHDYLTDIITFDNTQANEINGDIYISTERIKENADKYQRTFFDELHRVMIHGILHLTGIKDHSEREKKMMRELEDKYLSLLFDLRK